MKSSSHGRFTSAISTLFTFTLHLLVVAALIVPTAFAHITSVRPFHRTFLVAGSDPVPQSLPYAQDFSTLAHSSTAYPVGWQGWQIGAGSGAVFKTIEPTSDLGLTASSSASSTSGAVHNYNGKIGMLSTTSADPSIALAINSIGSSGVTITFDVMTIRNPYNGTTNTRISEVDLQYRICSSVPCTGTFTSASLVAGIYQNNTTAQTTGTVPQKSENKSITLPAAVNDQLNVQLRWVQRDVSGTGGRPSFAVDNIAIAGSPLCSAPTVSLQPVDQTVTYGAASVSFTSNASGDPAPTVHWEVNTGSGFEMLANGGGVSGADTTVVTIADPIVAMSGHLYRAVFTNECGGPQSVVSDAASLTADPLTINVTPDAAQTKVYGDADPILTFNSAPALIGDDSFTGQLSRSNGEDVGPYEITQGSLALDANYVLALASGAVFEITPKTLIASVVANDKVYDGTTAATFSCSLAGVVVPDDVACTGGNATFASDDVGIHQVTATDLAIAGADSGNYTLPVTGAIDDAAEIFARAVTVKAVSDTKVYDGSTVSAGVPIVSVGSIVAGDAGNFTQSFDTRHAGAGKILTPAGSIADGNGGGNYALSFESDATGVIAPRPMVVTAVAATKPFDGNVSSAGVPTIAPDVIVGDTPNFFQTYDTPTPGTNKTLTPAGSVTDGNAGSNYSYVFVPVNTGVITAASLCFEGFHAPIGGSVEGGNGGTFDDPVRAFKMNSTIPIKFTLYAAGCGGEPITTGIHTLQMIKYANAVDAEPAIDASPTDAATTGNQFRLSSTTWIYNLDTKRTPGISTGIWLVRATLSDGSVRTAWISIKK